MRGIRRNVLAVGSWALALAAAGCEPPDGTVEASEFDQSCTADEDCVAIGVGEYCDVPCWPCANAAINVADEERYNDRIERLRGPCPQTADSCEPCFVCCPAEAYCDDGTCMIR